MLRTSPFQGWDYWKGEIFMCEAYEMSNQKLEYELHFYG